MRGDLKSKSRSLEGHYYYRSGRRRANKGTDDEHQGDDVITIVYVSYWALFWARTCDKSFTFNLHTKQYIWQNPVKYKSSVSVIKRGQIFMKVMTKDLTMVKSTKTRLGLGRFLGSGWPVYSKLESLPGGAVALGKEAWTPLCCSVRVRAKKRPNNWCRKMASFYWNGHGINLIF